MESKTPLHDFVDKMFFSAGLDKLSPEAHEAYREQMVEQVLRRLGIMAVRELPPEKIPEMAKVMQTQPSDQEKVLKFFQDSIPDFEGKMTEELKSFAQEFISTAQKLEG